MTHLPIKRRLWACAVATVLMSAAIQAEPSLFEKLVAKREAERAAAQEATAKQPVLTQAEVDRLIIAIQ